MVDFSALPPEIDIPDPQLKDDGRKPDGSQAPELAPPPKRKLGFILDEENDEKIVKFFHKEREDQEPFMSRLRAVWKRNAWWREGRRWVRLEKKENQQTWEAKLPQGMGSAPPVPNKTDRLCRRTVNVIMVDPPYPECEPGDDSNEARDAAEFSTRYLSVKGAPSDLNMELICRTAADKAMTFASAFGWVQMDPTGAGHRPREVMAHPDAPTQDQALIDPETNGQAPDDALKKRYVRSDGALTDNPDEADLQWLPGPKVRLLTGKNVNFLPRTATSLREAIGIMITDHTTLGDLRQQFKDDIAKLSAEQLDELCKWEPPKVKEILPAYSPTPEEQKNEDGTWKDSQIVWTITIYYRRSAEYPLGCYAILAGKKLVLHKQTWTAKMPQEPAEDGTEQPEKDECLEIPVAQCRCLDDNTFDNGFGIGMAEHLGPADEVRASSLGYEMEYMFRFGTPQVYLPMGTIVQPKQLLLRDGTPIYFNPAGEPHYEDIPQLPESVPNLREEMGTDMDDESGLQQAAQGVEDPSVQSGIHAQTIIQEALKAVSNIKGNIGFFYIDLNRIILEQSRAFCTVPQLLSYVGKDGEYKEKEWSRTSFKNTRVVTIARGSFTMHTLVAKKELADAALDKQAIDKDDYMELVAGGVSPILGTQDNPDLMRVRRQIDKFTDGPPPGWLDQIAEIAKITAIAQQVAQGDAEGAQAAAQVGAVYQPTVAPPPIPPRPPGPFSDRIPSDYEPSSAQIRHRQIRRTLASSKFAALDPEWGKELLAEYAEMANAAGIQTVPQIQAMQAQQQANAAGGAPGAAQQPGMPAAPAPGAAPASVPGAPQ